MNYIYKGILIKRNTTYVRHPLSIQVLLKTNMTIIRVWNIRKNI